MTMPVPAQAYALIRSIIVKEGAYVNDPKDAGGATKWGITERAARAWGYTGDMRVLPQDVAIQIYYQNYFVKPGFDRVAAVNFLLAQELVDAYVNMGAGNKDTKDGPVFWLQRWLNAFNRGGSDYPDIVVDGVIGAGTINALIAYGKVPDRLYTVLTEACNACQGARYLRLIEANGTQERFAYGWLANRVMH